MRLAAFVALAGGALWLWSREPPPEPLLHDDPALVALHEKHEQEAALPEPQREAAAQADEAALPRDLREAREDAMAPVRYDEEERAFRESGVTRAQLRAFREDRLGPEAADRLEQLDADRARWDERLADFRARLAALPPEERAQGRAALLHQLFSEPEQLRVDALDRMQ